MYSIAFKLTASNTRVITTSENKTAVNNIAASSASKSRYNYNSDKTLSISIQSSQRRTLL